VARPNPAVSTGSARPVSRFFATDLTELEVNVYDLSTYKSHGYMPPPNSYLLVFRCLHHLVGRVKWRALSARPKLHRMVDQLLADWLFNKKP